MYKYILIVLSILLSSCVMLEVEKKLNVEQASKDLAELNEGYVKLLKGQKEFDLTNLEHRFAIAKARLPQVKDLRRLQPEEESYALLACVQRGLQMGIPFPLEGYAVGPRGLVCLPEILTMIEGGRFELEPICELFNMKYVSHTKEGKVLCEEETGLQKQLRDSGSKGTKV